MNYNQIVNLYSFCHMFNGISESIYSQCDGYLFEKYNSFIGYVPKIKNKEKLRETLAKNKTFIKWSKIWEFNDLSEFYTNPDIALFIFEIHDANTLEFSKLCYIFEKNIGNVELINKNQNAIHPKLIQHIKEIIEKQKSIKREIKLNEII